MFFNKRKQEEQHTVVDPQAENEIKRLIGYRFVATGVFGYTYYSTGDQVCSVSSMVAPSASVMIHGNSVIWESNFSCCTVFPGLTRSVRDESTGTQLFQIVYKDTGEYEINKSITAYCDAEKYTFCLDGTVIAKITRFSGSADHFIKPSDTGYNYEPYFEVVADCEIDTELLMLILAFPMLTFES